MTYNFTTRWHNFKNIVAHELLPSERKWAQISVRIMGFIFKLRHIKICASFFFPKIIE